MSFFFAGLVLASLDLLGLWALTRSLGRATQAWLKTLLLLFLLG